MRTQTQSPHVWSLTWTLGLLSSSGLKPPPGLTSALPWTWSGVASIFCQEKMYFKNRPAWRPSSLPNGSGTLLTIHHSRDTDRETQDVTVYKHAQGLLSMFPALNRAWAIAVKWIKMRLRKISLWGWMDGSCRGSGINPEHPLGDSQPSRLRF